MRQMCCVFVLIYLSTSAELWGRNVVGLVPELFYVNYLVTCLSEGPGYSLPRAVAMTTPGLLYSQIYVIRAGVMV